MYIFLSFPLVHVVLLRLLVIDLRRLFLVSCGDLEVWHCVYPASSDIWKVYVIELIVKQVIISIILDAVIPQCSELVSTPFRYCRILCLPAFFL